MRNKGLDDFLQYQGALGRIALNAYNEVDPRGHGGHPPHAYLKNASKFVSMLRGLTGEDKRISVDIIAEIITRSFSIREVAENRLSEQDIRRVAAIIACQIMDFDSCRLIESVDKRITA